jgi:hypothetical protein
MMSSFWRLVFCGVLVGGAMRHAEAFSLLGPLADWQTTEIGYNIPFITADLGGPMNIHEEYRWNIPLITYGFDESFLNYFGAKGVEEIEKAIKVFNDLPPFSEIDLSKYPLDTRRVNYRASALYLLDLKSWVMGAMLEVLGLGPAERYVWTLKSRTVRGDIPYYVVMKLNFDPITFEPTAYVNGTLYTYLILQTYTNPDIWEAVEVEVDPSLPSVSSVSATMTGGGTIFASGYYVNNMPGLFYTGLTRDDVGGLSFIYRKGNVNMEILATNVVAAPRSLKEGNYLIGAKSTSPWAAPPGLVYTNVTGTNAAVFQALRTGIDKLNFTRVDFDSYTGFWVPMTNVYVDYYVTNTTIKKQLVQRALAQPDILFSAADLGLSADGFPVLFRRTSGWVNLNAINGISGTALYGPGLILPPIELTFSKLGQYLINAPEGGEADGFLYFWWGSYDGTTNAPVVYPLGTSVMTIENLVQSGKVDEGPSPWRSPSDQQGR